MCGRQAERRGCFSPARQGHPNTLPPPPAAGHSPGLACASGFLVRASQSVAEDKNYLLFNSREAKAFFWLPRNSQRKEQAQLLKKHRFFFKNHSADKLLYKIRTSKTFSFNSVLDVGPKLSCPEVTSRYTTLAQPSGRSITSFSWYVFTQNYLYYYVQILCIIIHKPYGRNCLTFFNYMLLHRQFQERQLSCCHLPQITAIYLKKGRKMCHHNLREFKPKVVILVRKMQLNIFLLLS